MPERIKTTSHNIKDRRLTGITMEDLPHTIRDAFVFARGLGVRYISVDVLCILQDSMSDWASESTKMAQVYSSAYVTLAASSAEDTGTGLDDYSSEISRHPEHGVILSFPPDNDVTATVTCSPSSPSSLRVYISAPSWPNQEGMKLHLDSLQTRGWALQERHLSRRIVSFSFPDLVFECRSARASSRMPFIPPAFARLPHHHRRLLDAPPDDRAAAVRGFLASARWQRLVSQYTNRGLTFDRDVFYAIAGLAAAVGSAVGGTDQYLAGLWLSTMPASLCWQRQTITNNWDDYSNWAPYSTAHLADARRRAPSWSWASVVGPAHTCDIARPVASVLGASCKTTHDPVLGLVYEGRERR